MVEFVLDAAFPVTVNDPTVILLPVANTLVAPVLKLILSS